MTPDQGLRSASTKWSSQQARPDDHLDRNVILLAALVWLANLVSAIGRAMLRDTGVDAGSMTARVLYTVTGFLLTAGVWALLRRKPAPTAWKLAQSALPLVLVACWIHTVLSQVYFFQFSKEEKSAFHEYFTINELIPSYAGYLWMFLTWVGACATVVGSAVARAQDQRMAEIELSAQQAQMRALHYQLQPHFLLNSLNTVESLLGEQRIAEAKSTLANLAGFLQYTLTSAPTALVPLRLELETQSLYLNVEQVRFQDRLKLKFLVGPETEVALVPSMILQPLVENALTHGLATSVNTAVIEIGAQRRGDRLHLWVQDDAELSTQRKRKGLGIGLSNVRARLAAQYGDEAELIVAKTNPGWRSEIVLPFDVETVAAGHPPVSGDTEKEAVAIA